MGFLGFGNYSKPGPGVNKDEPPKAAPVRYFEILWRKLSKLVQVNLLIFVPFLIALVLAFLIYFIPFPYRGLSVPTENGAMTLDIWLMYACPIPFIFVSPFISGLTLITRNFAREEHAFIWSDFIGTAKSNVKYSLINGVICYVAYVVLSFSIIYYFNQVSTNWFFYIPLALCLVLAIVFVFAQFYIPTLIITFNLTMKQIYRNAFILAALGVGRNILLTVFFVALIVLLLYIPLQYAILLMIALGLLIIFALGSYTVSFVTYPLIQRYLIDPYNKQQEDAKAAEQGLLKGESDKAPDDGLPALNEDFTNDEDDDPDSYVYVNGRLMKKSDLQDK